ncbi:MAG: segregation/condensation protein A [Candidatus Magasanikbacteria bacterium]
MQQEFVTKQFSGPLDLLLSLLDEEKLDITDIALSEVTEQYLHHVENLEEKDAEELVDFLVIAAKLVLLKSKKLLPQLMPEEESGVSLEEQLRLYKKFVEASKEIQKHWDSREKSVFRIEPPRKAEGFVSPENLDISALHESFSKLVQRLKPMKPLPQTTIDRAVSMKQKITAIHDLLKTKKKAYFFDVVENAKNKTDVIVSFLALLELVKQKTVLLKQDDTFSDILIEKYQGN